jgi:hypothetical protein
LRLGGLCWLPVHRWRCGLVCWRIVSRAVVVGPVDPQFSPHNLVVVQIAHSGGGCIGVGELCEPEALGTAGFLVVNQSEVQNLANATKCLDDELFSAACKGWLAVRLSRR